MSINSRQMNPANPEPAIRGEAMLRDEYEQLYGWAPPEGSGELRQQLAAVRQHIHAQPAHERPTALCLSGGGVRSATFCLGVLQGLAERQRLGRFAYLSTVSGGGYIGGWLSSWIHHLPAAKNFDLLQRDLARGYCGNPGDTVPEHDPIERLRAYSNYLSPVTGLSIDSLTLAAIFLRNLLLNWCVWVPLLLIVVTLPRLYLAALVFRPPESAYAIAIAFGAALLIAQAIAYIASDLPGKPPPDAPDEVNNAFGRWCFMPLLVAAVIYSILALWFTPPPLAWVAMIGAAVHAFGAVVGSCTRACRGNSSRAVANFWIAGLAVLASGALGAAFLSWAVLDESVGATGQGQAAMLRYATFAVPSMLGCFWLGMTAYAGLLRRWTDEADREWWARASGWWLAAAIAWLALFGLVIYLPPWLLSRLEGVVSADVGLGGGAAALGILTSLIGYWSKNGETFKRQANTFIEATGLRLLDLLAALGIVTLLVFGSVVMSQVVPIVQGWGWVSPVSDCPCSEARIVVPGTMVAAYPTGLPAKAAEAYVNVLLQSQWCWVAGLLIVLLGIAFGVSWAIGVNVFSLHALYGNRLVRAYLGATRPTRKPHWFTGFDPDDDLPLATLWPKKEAKTEAPHRPRLFPVSNIALNLTKASNARLAWQQRKAASFTATPLHCGSESTWYVKTAQFGDSGRPGGMTLGRAVTISGAAASPNMGYHSSPLVSLMMALFNVRLGWWAANPRSFGTAGAPQGGEPGLGLGVIVDEGLGQTTDDRPSIYLSDGGHFENLGLYEMVRRRCHRIVVADATCDPEFSYADLHNAVRKVRVDLNIEIELPPLLPVPKRDGAATRRVIVGRIRYSGRDGPSAPDGWLYLIKPMLVGRDNEPPDLTDYAQSKAGLKGPFPHQSTGDQFFDEAQFESYRMLGRLSALEVFPFEQSWPVPDARRDPPAKPGCDAPTHPSPCAAGTSPLASLGSGLSSAMQGAALATALTVAGTVGVIGTLSLAPDAHVSLSQEDRALLRESLALTANTTANDLKVSLQRFEILAAHFESTQLALPGDALQAIVAALEQLQSSIDELAKKAPAAVDTQVIADAVTRSSASAAQALAAQLADVRRAIESIQRAPGTDMGGVVTELQIVNKRLEELRISTDNASPRRNIRGVPP